MRSAVVVCLAVGVAVTGWSSLSQAQTPQTLVNQLRDYRFITARRHNDIQGVEAVFDDYRKNWLRRQNTQTLVGNDSRDPRADTPICGASSSYGYDPDRMRLCGNGFVFRAHSNVIGARDTYNGANIRELGNLSYAGYEYLVSNDFFLGAGASGAWSRIDNKAGTGVRLDATEFAGHLLGGYRINSNNMIAWNLTAVRSHIDSRRPGDITGQFNSDTLFATGVWYSNVALTQTAYVSLGLDYTLQFGFSSEAFAESDGTRYANRPTRQRWTGDFTGSALFVQPLDGAELFARIGATVGTLNPHSRSVDVPIDVGGAMRLTDKIALTGSVGATYMFSNYAELRGTLRLTGRY